MEGNYHPSRRRSLTSRAKTSPSGWSAGRGTGNGPKAVGAAALPLATSTSQCDSSRSVMGSKRTAGRPPRVIVTPRLALLPRDLLLHRLPPCVASWSLPKILDPLRSPDLLQKRLGRAAGAGFRRACRDVSP